MNERFEVRLSGSGGQGLITAGIIMAEAASLHNGYNVIQSQSYGPEARGGASKAEVIISKGDLFFPKSHKLDMLLCLSQDACDKYFHDLRGRGTLILDSTFIKTAPMYSNTYRFPFTEIAVRECGKALVTNILCLGFLAGLLDYVTMPGLKKVVASRVPPAYRELNIKALEVGYGLIEKK